MLGTTTCNNSEVMFRGDRAVRPRVKFVSPTGTVNSKVPHAHAGNCVYCMSPANVAAGKS